MVRELGTNCRHGQKWKLLFDVKSDDDGCNSGKWVVVVVEVTGTGNKGWGGCHISRNYRVSGGNNREHCSSDWKGQ